ncbi:MAG: hypothetical protein HN781_08710 [Betaproteobacteria bacterium]|nr:hypothetical protein [Betaproteobacteria bacterium]
MSDVFVDRFIKFNVSQGVVRLDFARLEDIDTEKNEVKMSPSTRLVMPLDSFMNFIDQGSRLRSEIISQAQSSAEASGNEKAVVADEADKDPKSKKEKKKET